MRMISYTPLVQNHEMIHRERLGKPATVSSNTATPWLTVVEAAERLGYDVGRGRAPNSVYDIAHEIGHPIKGRFLIHRDDLDDYVRRQGNGR